MNNSLCKFILKCPFHIGHCDINVDLNWLSSNALMFDIKASFDG